MKRLLNTALIRAVTFLVFFFIQIAAVAAMLLIFKQYILYFYIACLIISVGLIIKIVSSDSNPAYKIAWLIPIMLLPVFGVLFYVMIGKNYLSDRVKEHYLTIQKDYSAEIGALGSDMDQLEKTSPEAAIHSRYIMHTTDVPPYENTASEFLDSGETMFARMKQKLKTAQRFIYMEYFIIDMGQMWDAILEILEEKAACGVDVRVIYDDFGSLTYLPHNYDKILEKKGIKACVFNKFSPVLTPIRLNNRDHRKICVIDGNTGFTGGVNIADKYINRAKRRNHWLDSGVMIEGRGVWSMTVMFLSMWDFICGEKSDYTACMPNSRLCESCRGSGFVQPYTDTPLDDEAVGENVYLNIINRAKKYVYITTPYLIIDNEMVTALCTAAKSGIDVRITTPAQSDSAIVHALTRSYYKILTQAGVSIFEYQGGFIHSKNFVSDDSYGVVGTINLDYRSLYLHYECGVWLYNTPSVAALKDDYLKTLACCRRISIDDCNAVPWYKNTVRQFLRLFAPLF
jgi:cardiolipin synthase